MQGAVQRQHAAQVEHVTRLQHHGRPDAAETGPPRPGVQRRAAGSRFAGGACQPAAQVRCPAQRPDHAAAAAK